MNAIFTMYIMYIMHFNDVVLNEMFNCGYCPSSTMKLVFLI